MEKGTGSHPFAKTPRSIWISTVQNSSNQIQSNSILKCLIVATVPQVGSVIEVGEIRVFIRRRIGEGGFAFVYQAEDMTDRSKIYALKRLLVRKLLMTSLPRQQQNTFKLECYGTPRILAGWEVIFLLHFISPYLNLMLCLSVYLVLYCLLALPMWEGGNKVNKNKTDRQTEH